MKVGLKVLYGFLIGGVSLMNSGALLAGKPAASEDQVTICHFPPGNPGNAHTITVGISAVQTHIDQHGDTLGECVVSADDCDSCAYSDEDYRTEGSCVSTCGILMK